MSTQGTATIDFGTAETTASVAVTGQAATVLTLLIGISGVWISNRGRIDDATASRQLADQALRDKTEQYHNNAITIRTAMQKDIDNRTAHLAWLDQQVEDLWKQQREGCRK